MENNFEEFGILIDEIDNLAHALNISMPPQFHVDQLKKLLPEKVERLKKIYVKITNENPWD